MLPPKNKLHLFIISSILFAAYCFIFGESGLIERMRLADEYSKIQQEIRSLKEVNRELVKKLKRYKEGFFFEEEAYKAAYINEGNKLLFIHAKIKDAGQPSDNSKVEKTQGFILSHLRVLWVVISVMILMIYIIRIKRQSDEVFS